MTSGVDWGDAPAWAAVVVAVLALLISVGSAVLSWKSLRWEQLNAEAALRSAEAAERANRFAELAVQRQLDASPGESGTDEPQIGVPEISTNPSLSVPGQPSDVRWRIENPSGNRYVLRNTGTSVAEHVEVDAAGAGPVSRNLPRDSTIRPGEGHDMLIMGTWGHPVPNQLYVRWQGQPEWTAVPIT